MFIMHLPSHLAPLGAWMGNVFLMQKGRKRFWLEVFAAPTYVNPG